MYQEILYRNFSTEFECHFTEKISKSNYSDCDELDKSNALYLKLVMGNVTDYFKPDKDYTYCDMLKSHNKHLWSYDGENWERPVYRRLIDSRRWLGGGSEKGGFQNRTWDKRETLSFWGNEVFIYGGYGGCCHCDYNDKSNASRAFTLEYGIGKRFNRHFKNAFLTLLKVHLLLKSNKLFILLFSTNNNYNNDK